MVYLRSWTDWHSFVERFDCRTKILFSPRATTNRNRMVACQVGNPCSTNCVLARMDECWQLEDHRYTLAVQIAGRYLQDLWQRKTRRLAQGHESTTTIQIQRGFCLVGEAEVQLADEQQLCLLVQTFINGNVTWLLKTAGSLAILVCWLMLVSVPPTLACMEWFSKVIACDTTAAAKVLFPLFLKDTIRLISKK